MDKQEYTRKASKRRIWLKQISWVFHWIAMLIGKQHGKAGLPRQDNEGWTSTYIERKVSSFTEFTNKEYAFCVDLLSDLRLEASKIMTEIAVMEESPEDAAASGAPASVAQQARAEKTADAKRNTITLRKNSAIIRLAEINEIIHCVDAIIEQRCDAANQVLKAHLMAYWTGVLITHQDKNISSKPTFILPNITAQAQYKSRHELGDDEMAKLIQGYLPVVSE